MSEQKSDWLRENRDDDDEGKFARKITLKGILCDKTVKGWIFLTIFATSVPILVYYFLIDQVTFENDDSFTCLVQNSFRVPCGRVNISSNDCERLYCCFDRSSKTCYHYLPSKYYYSLPHNSEDSQNGYAAARSTSPYNTKSLEKLYMAINERTVDTVSIIISQNDVGDQGNTLDIDKNYIVNRLREKLMIEVHRPNEDLLLTTTKGPLIASDNYWEWSFYLTNHTLLGLNRTLINSEKNDTETQVIYKSDTDHSSLPIFWAYNNNSFHGIIVKHEGPLEVVVLPSNLVLLRSLTGGSVELELSVGPTPKLLHDQQTKKAELPPIWALQTQICRKGINTNLTELLAEYNLELDNQSDCIHENLVMGIMNENTTTNMEELKSIIKSIREQGSKFYLSIPPHVIQNSNALHKKSEELDLLVKYNNSVYIGRYLNEIVAFPDYTHSNIQEYLKEFHTLISSYMDIEDIEGFVLHDNWPVNQFYNISINDTYFPYLSKDLQEALSFTLPWNATTKDGSILHIQTHNDYGASQLTSFQDYFTSVFGKHVFMMSASKSLDQTDPSIIQNVNVSWTALAEQISNVLFNSITGNHLVSLPVCGDTTFFRNSLQETLCLRWYLVAATMPMFRISSTEPYRYPSHLNTTFSTNVALNAIYIRNSLIPYYFTLLNQNEPIVRPMFYDFYDNETTFSLRHQYMVGDSLLVAFPLSSGRNRLQVYLPSRVGIWYEFWAGDMFNTTKEAWIDFDIVETDFIAFVSQGHILPLKDENALDLTIGLDCSTTACTAEGTLLDSDSYITFQSDKTALTINNIPQSNCNLLVRNINLYYYDENGSQADFLYKNEDLCAAGTPSITISYS